MLKNPLAVIFNGRIALHFGKDGDDNLAGGVALEIGQRVVQLLGGASRNDVRVIIEVAGRFGRHDFRRRRAQ